MHPLLGHTEAVLYKTTLKVKFNGTPWNGFIAPACHTG